MKVNSTYVYLAPQYESSAGHAQCSKWVRQLPRTCFSGQPLCKFDHSLSNDVPKSSWPKFSSRHMTKRHNDNYYQHCGVNGMMNNENLRRILMKIYNTYMIAKVRHEKFFVNRWVFAR
jgi:hypothetical protein